MQADLLSGDDNVYVCKQMVSSSEEATWTSIDWTGCNVLLLTDTVTGLPTKEYTEVRACWSPDHLHVWFLGKDSNIVSDFTERDEPLYEQDVVEVFIDEEGNGSNYLELEISPRNVVFDAQIENDGKGSISVDQTWCFKDLLTSVDTNGEGSLSVFISIPASNFSKPLESGTRWKGNFYRIDEGLDGIREYQAWRPTGVVNYHIPSKFGSIVLL